MGPLRDFAGKASKDVVFRIKKQWPLLMSDYVINEGLPLLISDCTQVFVCKEEHRTIVKNRHMKDLT